MDACPCKIKPLTARDPLFCKTRPTPANRSAAMPEQPAPARGGAVAGAAARGPAGKKLNPNGHVDKSALSVAEQDAKTSLGKPHFFTALASVGCGVGVAAVAAERRVEGFAVAPEHDFFACSFTPFGCGP